MKTCAKCGQSVALTHRLGLDSQSPWYLCCLCAAELAATLDSKARMDTP